jgi:hypothetical protein
MSTVKPPLRFAGWTAEADDFDVKSSHLILLKRRGTVSCIDADQRVRWQREEAAGDWYLVDVADDTRAVVRRCQQNRCEYVAYDVRTGRPVVREWLNGHPGEVHSVEGQLLAFLIGDKPDPHIACHVLGRQAPKWKLSIKDVPRVNGLTVHEGVVFVHTDKAALAIDGDTGGTLWDSRPRGGLRGWGHSIRASAHVVLVQGKAGLIGLNPRTGEALWRLAGAFGWTLEGKRVYDVTRGTLSVLDARSGDVVLRRSLMADLRRAGARLGPYTVFPSGGFGYVVLDTQIAAVRLRDGHVVWTGGHEGFRHLRQPRTWQGLLVAAAESTSAPLRRRAAVLAFEPGHAKAPSPAALNVWVGQPFRRDGRTEVPCAGDDPYHVPSAVESAIWDATEEGRRRFTIVAYEPDTPAAIVKGLETMARRLRKHLAVEVESTRDPEYKDRARRRGRFKRS